MFGKGPGPMEVLVILAIVLLLFGATRLPQLASALGRSIKEFKSGAASVSTSLDETPNAKPAEDRSPEDPKSTQH